MTTPSPLYLSDPEKWLHETSEKYELFCVVLFRGSWCKYDHHYLKLISESPAKPSNTHMVAWTSEGDEGAKKANEDWKLVEELGYDYVLGDENCALAKYLIEDELLPKLVIQPLEEATLDSSKMFVAGKEEVKGYPNGLVQPGIIIYAHKGNMCMHWEAKVEEGTAQGASHRPAPDGKKRRDAFVVFVVSFEHDSFLIKSRTTLELWEEVKHRKHALDLGSTVMPIHGDRLKKCTLPEDVE